MHFTMDTMHHGHTGFRFIRIVVALNCPAQAAFKFVDRCLAGKDALAARVGAAGRKILAAISLRR